MVSSGDGSGSLVDNSVSLPLISSEGTTLPTCPSSGLDSDPFIDPPPGFSGRALQEATGASTCNVMDNLSPTDPLLGSPLPSSYRDILVAHLPVYTDHLSTKEGVSPLGVDRYRDFTIRRKRRGGRGIKDTSKHPTDCDSYIPLSVRLAGGVASDDISILDKSRDIVGSSKVTGALRGLPHDKVKG